MSPLHHPLLPETDSPGCALGFRPSVLNSPPEAPLGGDQGGSHPWRSQEAALGPSSRTGGGDSGTGPGLGRRASRWGLGGREGAGASGSPSDGEMWPFTFTLQCQHLNHCLRARAQGCWEPASDKAAPAPLPGTPRPAEPPPPFSRTPPPFSLRAFLPCPFPSFLSLLFPLYGVGLKDLSQGPGGHGVLAQITERPGFSFLLQSEVAQPCGWSAGP